MVRTLRNMKVIDALIRDEEMASKDYAKLAMYENPDFRKLLLSMSADEARHKENLEKIKRFYLRSR